MTNENEPRADTWEDFSGDYLKCDLIKEFPLILVAKDIVLFYDKEEEKARMDLIVEFHNKDWKIGVNKTNQQFMRSNGITFPREIIGKKLTFNKIKVRNPAQNKLVDSFILEKIE